MDFKGASEYAIMRLRNEVDEKYYYHNLNHTIDVCRAVEVIARAENIIKKDLLLLKTAAIFHDLGMVEEYFRHEEISIEILQSVLPDFDYSPAEIDKISRLIFVTKLIETPRNIDEKIICDADLGYLGQPDYFEIAHNLRLEWAVLGQRTYSDIEWILYQLEFMQHHSFYTKSARTLYDKGKKQNIDRLKKAIVK